LPILHKLIYMQCNPNTPPQVPHVTVVLSLH